MFILASKTNGFSVFMKDTEINDCYFASSLLSLAS